MAAKMPLVSVLTWDWEHLDLILERILDLYFFDFVLEMEWLLVIPLQHVNYVVIYVRNVLMPVGVHGPTRTRIVLMHSISIIPLFICLLTYLTLLLMTWFIYLDNDTYSSDLFFIYSSMFLSIWIHYNFCWFSLIYNLGFICNNTKFISIG